jgi:hypothetical protein
LKGFYSGRDLLNGFYFGRGNVEEILTLGEELLRRSYTGGGTVAEFY